MGKINFIVIKKYNNKKAEMHVFTDDGKEAIYPVAEENKIVQSSRALLKKLAEQNGLSYSVEGLRKLKDLRLLHYMNEEEFDRIYFTMKQGNENQAHYQNEKDKPQPKLEEEPTLEEKWLQEFLSNVKKNPNLLLENSKNSYFDIAIEKKQLPDIYRMISDYIPLLEEPKINFIIIKKYENKKAEMHVFTNDGKEAVYPVSNDGKEVLPSSHAYLKKLAEQNGLSYSAEGLRKLKDSGLLHYMNEEVFDDLYSIIKQENEDQIRYQEEKKALQKAQFLQTHGLREADLDLDYSKVKAYIDCEDWLSMDDPGNDDSIEEPTKSKLKDRMITLLEGARTSKKRKKVIGSAIGAAVILAIVKAHTQAGQLDLNDVVSITGDATKKELTKQKNNENKKIDKPEKTEVTEKTSEPTPANHSDVETAPQYSALTVKAGEIKENQNITNALNSADINNEKKVHLSSVYSWLKFFNGSFANHYYSKKDDIKPAHRWNEAIADYLLFNNINHTTVYKIFDTYSLDTDQLVDAFKRGMKQDTQAYIISDESLKVDQLINNEKGKEFYKEYKSLFKKYKSLDSKTTKEEVVNTFNKLVRKDFLTAEREIAPYKLAVLPIINAFYELSGDMDIAEKLSQAELDYVNERVMVKVESRLGEYSNGLVVNKMLYGDTPDDTFSYQELKELALDELKEKDNYNVEKEKRDITKQKVYKKVMQTLK